MLETLHSLRHWLAQNNIRPEKVHVTISFPEHEDAYRASEALKKNFGNTIEVPVNSLTATQQALRGRQRADREIHQLLGFDLTFASSERCLTDRAINADARIRELERENADLRSRYDCALLELETHLTY